MKGIGQGMKRFLRLPYLVFLIIMLMAFLRWERAQDLHQVIKVYDGDTIEIEDGRKIRLIGVDAPEVDSPYSREEPFGARSKQYLTTLLSGKKIAVRTGKEPFDRFGRTLAYVYADDVLVNGRIIRDGFARAYYKFDYDYKDLFIAYEKEAMAKNIGIWDAGTPETEYGFQKE